MLSYLKNIAKFIILGSISIGAEIVVSVNGVPLKIFPAIQFKLSGKLSGTTRNGGCVRG